MIVLTNALLTRADIRPALERATEQSFSAAERKVARQARVLFEEPTVVTIRTQGGEIVETRSDPGEGVETYWFLAPAPGWYGQEGLVLAAWSDLTDARACAHRAGRQYVLREGYQVRPGTRWLQVYEQTYPAVRL